MRIVSDRDWQAKWIGAGAAASAGAGESAAMPVFRRSFRLDKQPTRATVFICGLGQHELHINSAKVGQDVLEPGWTNYAKTCLYVTHEVTSHVRPGENTIDVLLGNGMYSVTGTRYKKFKGSFGPPKLILEFHAESDDGNVTTIATDESWQVAHGPITFSCIYGGEDYDARVDRPTDWQPATIVDGPDGRLIEQPSPPIRVMQRFSPVRVTEPRSGVRVYDLGQNFSGWPKLRATGAAGAKITLMPGELVDDAGCVTQKHTGSPVSFSYTLRGDATEQTWHPRFSYTGFRYVQAEGDLGALLDIEGQFIHSTAPVVGEFSCSNELLNRIHVLILAAIRSNLQSVITDCPHREKLGWLEQTHLMGPSIMSNFEVRGLYRKISLDLRDAQRADGMIPTIAPQYTTFKPPWDVFNDSPEWGSAALINPWLVYQRYGDRTMLEENYNSMRRYVDYLQSRADGNGIIDYGLADWYDIGPGDPGFSKLTSAALTATAVYFQDLVILQKVAALLGKPDDAEAFIPRIRRTRAAFNAKLFDRDKRCYDRGSQTAQAMPLALGLVDPEHRDAVLAHLVRDIRAHDNHITAGDVGFRYVIVALAEAGRSDVIFDLLSRTDPPSYGAQVARGATSLTEAWDANPKSSQNHLMLGHAESWLHEWLGGIQIDASQPPPRQIVIRPTPVGDVTWANARHDSVLGPVKSHWTRDGDNFELSISVPTTATIHMPGREPFIVGAGAHLLKSLIFNGSKPCP